MADVRLGGCATNVALLYLKSLGIFRAITRPRGGDPDARARWDGDTFVLDTRLDGDGLVDFFTSEYRPLPLVSPWNVLSGFHSSDTVVGQMRQSKSERLEEYRRVIDETFCMLNDVFGDGSYPCGAPSTDADAAVATAEYKTPDKPTLRKRKDEILETARNTLPDDVVEWIDAAFVMAASGKWTAGPILGSGGVDGKTEMSTTYMKYVLRCFPDAGRDKSDAEKLVRNTLFGSKAALQSKGAVVGHLFPGAFATFAAGPPSDDQYTLLNPWDYILAMEGMTFFGGGVSRRGERGYAAFPFSVKLSNAGFGTASGRENGGGKDSAEVWFPLWDMPATYSELRHVFYEGLVQSSKMPTTGVGMAVALANYGAMRGINAFERYGMFKRKGRDHHLVGVGRIRAGDPRGGGRVIQEIEPWLDAVRAKGEQLAAKKGKLPSSVESALRAADDAVLWYCQDRSPQRLQDVLVALGRLDRQIATSPRLKLRPLGRLSCEWLAACNTRTPEYHLAASLASIYGRNYPVRCNLEPIVVPDDARKPVVWDPASTTTAWGRGGLVRNLVSVLERRCMDRRGEYAPGRSGGGIDDRQEGDSTTGRHKLIVPLGSRVSAPVADIVRFIEGKVDDNLIHDLLLPMSAIQYRDDSSMGHLYDKDLFRVPGHVPEYYIALKANFPPVRPRAGGAGPAFEPTLIGLLRAGSGARAVDVAKRRLRISGYNVPPPPRLPRPREQGQSREQVSGCAVPSGPPVTGDAPCDLQRLCASLLFPVRPLDMGCLIRSLDPSHGPKKWQGSEWMDCHDAKPA